MPTATSSPESRFSYSQPDESKFEGNASFSEPDLDTVLEKLRNELTIHEYTDEQKQAFTKANELYGVGDSAFDNPNSYIKDIVDIHVKQIHITSEDFPHLHIEPLLDQTIDLLSRAIGERETANALSSKAFQTKLELEEFRDLDEIHQREITDGAYDIAYTKAYAEYRAESSLLYNLRNSLFRLNYVINNRFEYSAINKVYQARIYSAFTSNGALFTHSKDYMSYTIQGTDFSLAGKKNDVALELSSIMADWELGNQTFSIHRQRDELEGRISAAEERAEGHKKTAEWLRKSIQHRFDRLAISRRLNAEKVQAVTAPAGALNYVEQLNPIKERISFLFQQARQRLISIAKGFSEVYGVSVPLPDNIKAYNYLDSCYEWALSASNWLISFQRHDKNVTRQFSVRKLVGDDAWVRGLQEHEWKFSLDLDEKPGTLFPRMRGVSAHTIGQELVGTFEFTVTPPVEASTRTEDKVAIVNQQEIGNVYLGKVSPWSPEYDNDIGGVIATHNASPYGEWHISVGMESTQGISAEYISDILIDIHLAIH